MSEASMAESRPSTANGCSALPRGAMDCTLARIARAIWPDKTPEHWAAAAGVQVRIAKYWLAGRHLSDTAKLALVKEILD